MTAPKVVKEFLWLRIAPLQHHSCTMWTYTGHQDRMRIQEGDLAPDLARCSQLRLGSRDAHKPRLTFVWRRFESLRALDVTAPKVVKEFLQRRIAPLQRHSRRMWDYAGHKDCMRL